MIQFAQPLWLLGLGALALPVLAHLIFRQLALPWPFPSLRFIRTAPLPRRGRRKLRDLFLLLCRLGLYACLILILAQPRWVEDAEDLTMAQGETILMVDLSASMGGWGSWDQLQEEARQLAEAEHSLGRAVGVVGFAREVVFSMTPTRDLGAVRAALSDIETTLEVANPTRAVTEALPLFRLPVNQRLALFSDFQRSDWHLGNLPRFPRELEITVHPPAGAREGNLALLSAQVFPIGEGRLRLLAQVLNTGSEAARPVVELEAAGRVLTRPLEVPARQASPVLFELDTPADPAGLLRLPADTLEADNHYHIWLAPPPPALVLLTAAQSESADELFFTRAALQAGGEGDWSRFTAGLVSPEALATGVLERAAALFLPAGLREETPWEEIRAFVEEGGLLVVTLGPGATRTLRELRQQGLADYDFQGIAGRGDLRRETYHIGELAPGTPLANLFGEDAARDLYLASLREYVRLEDPTPASEGPRRIERIGRDGTSVLLRSEDGHPLILRKPVGEGTLMISTFPWSANWTDLPLRNAFVPLVREIFAPAQKSAAGLQRLTVGESFPLSLMALAEANNETGQNREVDEESVFTTGPVDLPTRAVEPGIFVQEGQPFEVNVDRAESTPEMRLPEEVSAAFANARRGEGETTATNTGVQDLVPAFLLLGAVFFLLEMLMAALTLPRLAQKSASQPKTTPSLEGSSGISRSPSASTPSAAGASYIAAASTSSSPQPEAAGTSQS